MVIWSLKIVVQTTKNCDETCGCKRQCACDQSLVVSHLPHIYSWTHCHWPVDCSNLHLSQFDMAIEDSPRCQGPSPFPQVELSRVCLNRKPFEMCRTMVQGLLGRIPQHEEMGSPAKYIIGLAVQHSRLQCLPAQKSLDITAHSCPTW